MNEQRSEGWAIAFSRWYGFWSGLYCGKKGFQRWDLPDHLPSPTDVLWFDTREEAEKVASILPADARGTIHAVNMEKDTLRIVDQWGIRGAFAKARRKDYEKTIREKEAELAAVRKKYLAESVTLDEEKV